MATLSKTMIKKKLTSFFFLALIVASGCEPTNSPTSLVMQPTEASTSTPVNPIRTSIPTRISATITQTVPSSPFDKCLPVEITYPGDLTSVGSLILNNTEETENGLIRSEIYRMDMQTKQILELAQPGENILYTSISQDGKWMAYKKTAEKDRDGNLIISDSLGELQKVIPWESDWLMISSWLDSERLVIEVYIESSDNASTSKSSSTFLIFNPFTNERNILQPDFPDIYESLGFSGLVGTAYNTKLDRVVYLQGDPAFLEPLHYVLWDIPHRQKLADFEVIIQPTAVPRWSSTGRKFALAASIKEDIYQTWPAYELYSVSDEGQIVQLTYFTDFYPWTYIEDFSWSPNGRYIAFWFSSWTEEKPGWELSSNRYLAVVDTENNNVTNYCIEGKLGANGRIPLPIWSPSENQIAVESPTSDGHSQVVLLDLPRHIAVLIDENKTPVGWVSEP